MDDDWLEKRKEKFLQIVEASDRRLEGLISWPEERRLILLATDHSYQTGVRRDTRPPSVRPRWTIQRFQDQVDLLVQRFEVIAIAEEMSIEGILTAWNMVGMATGRCPSTYTAESRTGQEIGVRLVDPDTEERRKFGIVDPGFCELMAGPRGRNFGRRQDFALREHFWAERIAEVGRWPLLFVCGSDHRKVFGGLLRKFGVEVLDVYWNPYNGERKAESNPQEC